MSASVPPLYNAFPAGHETAPRRVTFLEADLQPWHDRMEGLMAQGARIIAFRGAGGATGIEPSAAEAMGVLLERYVTDLAADGRPVVLMYDGDDDVREYPDIGSVFGTLADKFAASPHVIPVAVQTAKWYTPRTPGAALCSAMKTPYETYIFNEEATAGLNLSGRAQAHSALSQSEALVAYPGYEQVILGAAGSATANQLIDLARKTSRRPADIPQLRVTILAAHNNPALAERLQADPDNPDPIRDAIKAQKLARHSSSPYGLLCTAAGEFALDPADYPGISFNFRRV